MAATAALTALTLASAASLFRVFAGRGWVGPVLATVVAAHIVAWELRRRPGVLQPVAFLVALAAVALAVVWTVFGYTTIYGFPGRSTWSHVDAAVGAIGTDFAQLTPPVTATHGLVLLAATGCGAMAVIADWLAFRWRRPLVAVLPELIIFMFGCAAGVGGGRATVIGIEVAAVCCFLLVDRACDRAAPVWFAGRRTGSIRWMLTVGGLSASAAVMVALVLTPTLTKQDGAGPAGWRAGFGGGSGARIVPNPLVSLQTRLLDEAHVPVFEVTAAVASYWRLTSLDQFDGSTWSSTGSYRNFSSKLPGTAPVSGVRTTEANFLIEQLDSVWLPEQFNPLSVQGVRGVSYDPLSDSLITANSTSDGLTYSVSSYEVLDTLSPAALSAAPPASQDSGVSADLELPAVVDGRVTALAAQITAGQHSDYAKALAIETYLRSAPFSYSLNPPSDGTGSQALYNFLFVTHEGYCQQFAGAYAVLARAAGLPTRLAVGFTTGDPITGGRFQVYDADAHTWPEVYFGSRLGWVPFEPTPGFTIPGTAGYAGAAGSSDGPAATTPSTLPQSSSPTAPPVTRPAATREKPPTTEVSPAGRHATPRASSGIAGWLWPVGLVAAGLVWVVANAGGRAVSRRRRRTRALAAGPAAAVLDTWWEVTRSLAWQEIRRQPFETDDEFAVRATYLLQRRGLLPPARLSKGGLVGLAGLAQLAVYGTAVPADAPTVATEMATELRRTLWAATPWGRRLRRLLAVPPGTWARPSGPAPVGFGGRTAI